MHRCFLGMMRATPGAGPFCATRSFAKPSKPFLGNSLRRQVRSKGQGCSRECDSGIHEELVVLGDTGIAETGILLLRYWGNIL